MEIRTDLSWFQRLCSRLLPMSALFLILALGDYGLLDDVALAQNADSSNQYLLTYPNLENPDGEVVLENEHVVLQRFVIPPGEWEGIHSHPGNQLFVHIKGGEWSGRAGGESTYDGSYSETGSVGWMDAIPLSEGHESGNTGDEPIDLLWVTLKGDGPINPNAAPEPQFYPNIPLELLFENELVIVQRVIVEPGEWEGIHSHPGNQIYVHINGGEWSERRGGEQFPPSGFSETGSVGWMEEVPMSEAHESGNTGDTTIDLIWITLK